MTEPTHPQPKPPADPQRQPAVRLQGVRKVFGSGDAKVEALRGVDLTLPANEVTFLVGPSGCGKTTLVSIIAGVLSPTEGQVQVFGVDWSNLSEDEKTRRRGQIVGFVFQDFNLVPMLTAQENVAVALLVQGRPRAVAEKRAAEVLDQVGLGHRLAARPDELSGGMQQRVAIARALAPRPRLLVCDEPTGNLDHRSGAGVMRLIRDTGRGDGELGRCVIVVTHDDRTYRYADRIEEMEDGRVLPEPSAMLMRQLEQSHARAEHDTEEAD